MAASLQHFIPLLTTQDIKKRIQLGSDILSCLQNPSCLLECDEIGFFIDSISSWLNNSNFKVAQNGIEIMTILAEEMKEDFKPYISTIFPATVDRLGDSKDQVRLQAKGLMLKLMSPVSSPQYVFDKLGIAFNHKNFRVREEVMVLLQQTLDKFGSTSLTISRLMPALVKLLGDPNSQVRDTAMATLVHVYKHVGERLRHDLSKRAGIPAPKLQLLFTKFDEVKNAGALLPTATDRTEKQEEELDNVVFFTCSGIATKETIAALVTVINLLIQEERPAEIKSAILTAVHLANRVFYLNMKEVLLASGWRPVAIEIRYAEEVFRHIIITSARVISAIEEHYGPYEPVDGAELASHSANLSERYVFPPSMDYGFRTCLFGFIMLFLVKKMNSPGYYRWRASRWNAFINSLGLPRDVFPAELLCSRKSALLISRAITSVFELRREFFRLVLFTYHNTLGSFSRIAWIVIKFCRGAELTHIYLISEHIIQSNSTLMALPDLKYELEIFESALRKLLTYDDFAFIKLLKPKEELEFLKKERFKNLLVIALVLGREYDPSLKNYGGPKMQNIENLPIVVKAKRFLALHPPPSFAEL